MRVEEVRERSRTGNVAAVFDETVRHHGNALAIETGERELTRTALREAARRFAGGLTERGYGPGDTLLCYLPNCPKYLTCVIGAFRAGVVSPVNPLAITTATMPTR